MTHAVLAALVELDRLDIARRAKEYLADLPRSSDATSTADGPSSPPADGVAAPPLALLEKAMRLIRGFDALLAEEHTRRFEAELKLSTVERDLREVREYIEQAVYVMERLPESDEKAELGAILEQRFAVISECRECGYPLFSKLETLCRFCDKAPMVERDTRGDE